MSAPSIPGRLPGEGGRLPRVQPDWRSDLAFVEEQERARRDADDRSFARHRERERQRRARRAGGATPAGPAPTRGRPEA